MAGNAIEARGVEFSYQGTRVLRGVSFALKPGEFGALVGSNGSGKSTLLRVLLGLLRPSAGEVNLLGSAPARQRERWRIGYVPQRPLAGSHLPATVEEVVAAGRVGSRSWVGGQRRGDRAEVEHALSSVALLEHRRLPMSELSGGQQQRAFIAKALASRPDLLVLDEPTAGVDVESRRRFRESLLHLVSEHGSAILLVSHELGAVAEDLDRVMVLREGVIAFDGTPSALVAQGVSLGVHPEDLPVWLEGGSP